MAKANALRTRSLAPSVVGFGAACEAFLGCCRARNLSPNTVTYYDYRLKAFGAYLRGKAPSVGVEEITPQLIRDFVAQETCGNSASTANHSICTLRAFFNYLVRDGFLDESPMSRVQKVRQTRRIIQTFSLEEVERILATCGRNFVGARDRAIILLLLDCGLRASELCGLQVEDASWAEQTLLVRGKGDKERLVPFGQNAGSALTQYLTRRGQLETPNLFVTCYADPFDRHRLSAIVETRCKKAAISGVRCSPHTFRHTFAVSYLRAGGDVFSLQKILGHADLTMTRRYAELSETDVRQKHRLFSPADLMQPTKPVAGRKRLK